ncbi:MAG: Ig-like domain-containing protein [Spirochaetes bacterium]|nr:Ig-like domain-containing protein [Spirochaetota bacterium]
MNRRMVVVFGLFILMLSAALVFSGCPSTGTGGVTDADDDTPPSVVQAVPPNMSSGVDPATVIALFFDDALIASTVTTSSVQVTRQVNGDPIAGQLFLGQSQAGNTIVTFVPSGTLPLSEWIDVYLPATGGVQDDGGNELAYAQGMSFQAAGSSAPALPGDNLSFEQGDTGIVFSGDGIRLGGAQGEIAPSDSSWMAAISSGEDYIGGGVVSSNEALDYTTSILTTGDITVTANILKFDYDFVSAEFNEWVGSEFDDTFVVAVRGPSGVHSEVVTSVNIVGTVPSVPVSLPAAFTEADYTLASGDGEDGAGRTGWNTKSLDVSSFGSPISIAFIVSDVGDSDWTTIVFIDNIRFE